MKVKRFDTKECFILTLDQLRKSKISVKTKLPVVFERSICRSREKFHIVQVIFFNIIIYSDGIIFFCILLPKCSQCFYLLIFSLKINKSHYNSQFANTCQRICQLSGRECKPSVNFRFFFKTSTSFFYLSYQPSVQASRQLRIGFKEKPVTKCLLFSALDFALFNLADVLFVH